MDPHAALQDLLIAVQDGDIERVHELSEALTEWMARGGYPPEIIGRSSLGAIWHLAVTKAVIKLAKAQVRIVAAANRETSDS